MNISPLPDGTMLSHLGRGPGGMLEEEGVSAFHFAGVDTVTASRREASPPACSPLPVAYERLRGAEASASLTSTPAGSFSVNLTATPPSHHPWPAAELQNSMP